MKIKRSIADYDEAGDDEAHEKLRAAADWSGPVEQRYCTDLFWLVLICACWVAMTAVGIYAVQNGDYRLVLYPLDYDGNVCGTDYNDRDMTEYPFLYYTNAVGGVCVQECPSLKGKTEDNLTDVHTLITYTGVYQTSFNLSQVSTDFVQVADYSYTIDEMQNDTNSNSNSTAATTVITDLAKSIFDTNNFQCTDEVCFGESVAESWTTNGINRGFGFAYYLADTFPLFQRCFLTTEARQRLSNLTDDGTEVIVDVMSQSSELQTANDFLSHLYGDVWNARWYILGFGFGASLAVSLVYMMLLRLPWLLSALVWFSIACVIGIFGAMGYYASFLVEEWRAQDPPVVRDDQIKYTEIASYVLYGIAGLLLLIAICLRKQIQLAVYCVKQAGKAINNMIFIFVVPFLQGIGLLAFTIVWAYYGAHLASLGTIGLEYLEIPLTDFEIPVRTYSYSENIAQLGWFLLFCFYWTSGFILAIGEMVVAMAISKWYFTVDKRGITQHLPFSALWSTIIYHLGTCAIGSLIIAIIKLLRSLLNSLKKKIAEVSNKQIAETLLCCCSCCLCCLEKCVQFINENAYIQCAIFGTPFFTSGRKAFFLILRNAARIGAVSYVSAAVLVIGKLFIAALTTFGAYYALVEHLQLELWSYGGPVAIIFILSYFVADMFMDVFDISILTILHCFIADEEMFDGRARYADGSLKDFVDKYGALDE